MSQVLIPTVVDGAQHGEGSRDVSMHEAHPTSMSRA